MAGVTDTLFFGGVIRRLAVRAADDGVHRGSQGITRSGRSSCVTCIFRMTSIRSPRNFFGASPEVMGEAARMVEDLGYDAVDINLGCPAKKVVKCGGSGLLRDMPLLEQIFRAVRAAVKNSADHASCAPGGMKIPSLAVDVAKLAESVGVEAIRALPQRRTAHAMVMPCQST